MMNPKSLAALALGIVFWTLPAAAQLPAAPQALIVVAPLVSSTDRHGTERDDELLCGQTAQIIGPQNDAGLYPVLTEYGYRTWLAPSAFKNLSPDEATAWRAARTHQVIAPLADVLPRPETESYPPVATLPRGSWVQVTGPEDGNRWLPVTLTSGQQGYMRRPALRPLRQWGQFDEATTRAYLVADAQSYLTTAYRWGGKSPQGIDCSGLTSMAYMLNGLNIYRNSRPEVGYPIALVTVAAASPDHYTRSELTRAGIRPGDLIYWAGHTGMYIGRGRYIHANGLAFSTTINSLIPGDADFRPDLARPTHVLAWGTAFPRQPEKIIVRNVRVLPFVKDGRTRYRFYASIDGYAPDEAIVYPEGLEKPDRRVVVKKPRFMLYAGNSENENVPVWFYDKPGRYEPAVVFINAHGWRPQGRTIQSPATVITHPLVVK